MKKLHNRLLLLFLGAALVSSCESGGSNVSGSDKLDYRPEINKVEIDTLKKKDFPLQLLSNGKLSSSTCSRLYFGTSGTIESINVSNGELVSKGELIASLDSREFEIALESASVALSRARLEYLDVLAGLGYSPSDTASAPADLLALAKVRSGYSAARLDFIKAERALEGTRLCAPFAGRVADIKLNVHEQSGSEAFCTLMDDSSFKVSFTVLESEYSFLEKGQDVKVQPFTAGGSPIKGKISSINPKVDGNGLVAVEAVIPGDPRLIDGMNVKVTVERTLSRQLVVPKSAVVVRDNLDVLFRYNDGKAEWVYVNLLNANSESYVVEANSDRGAELSEGDLVIVSGNLNLADGSAVELNR